MSFRVETRRAFLKQIAAGAVLVASRPSWAGADLPMCRIVRPGDPDYDGARAEFNRRFDVYPRAILFACSTDDVVQGVRMARDKGVGLCARAGGHSFEGYSLLEDGWVIDVSQIRHVQVAEDRRSARVGAGVKLGEVYRQLWDAGQLVIPGGTCPSVGLTGLTLGGGFGLLSRRRGLTCDALIEAEMVTAGGEVVRANENQNPDLFWALRGGGGGNFGIVTELIFRVEPIGDVAVASMSWPWEQIRDVTDAWQRWAPAVDRRLVSIIGLVPPAQPLVLFAFHDGTVDELRALMQPITKVGTPTLDVQAARWIDLTRGSTGRPGVTTPKNGIPTRFKGSSAYLYEPLPSEAIGAIVENLSSAPGTDDILQLDNYGGAVADIAPDATAFFHRGALASLQFWAEWREGVENAAHLAWVDRFRRDLLPWTRGAYVNYIDGDIADWPAQYHGTNFDRLRQVKRDWDPDDVFHFPQSIPL
jgi:FAD/FMN-containing dehydrogenase